MTEILRSIFALVLGGVLGAVFYRGLFWTIRKALVASRPELWFFCSFIVRASLIMLCFSVISDGSWQRLLLCLLGFYLGRLLTVGGRYAP